MGHAHATHETKQGLPGKHVSIEFHHDVDEKATADRSAKLNSFEAIPVALRQISERSPQK